MGIIPEHEIIELSAAKILSSGSALRTALLLSAISGRPFSLSDICVDRRYTGLDAPKLELVKLFAQATTATVKGASIGSERIEFVPTTLFAGKTFELDFKNASAVTLPAHALMLASLFSKKKTTFVLRGGTQSKGAPTASFLQEFAQRYLRPYVQSLKVGEAVVGFHPLGVGELQLEVKGRFLLEDFPPRLEVVARDELVAIKGVIIATQEKLITEALETIRSLAMLSLKEAGAPLSIETQHVQAQSNGVSMLLTAMFGNHEGYDNDFPYTIMVDKTWSALGESSLQVIEDGALAFCRDFVAKVRTRQIDEYTVELLLPLLAIVGGKLQVRKLTPRMQAIIHICEHFLEIAITKRAGFIQTPGYVQRFRDELPEIEDL